MEKNVPGDETGIQMGQASFQRFLEDSCSSEQNTEEFTEEIAKNKIGNSQDRDSFVEDEDC